MSGSTVELIARPLKGLVRLSSVRLCGSIRHLQLYPATQPSKPCTLPLNTKLVSQLRISLEVRLRL